MKAPVAKSLVPHRTPSVGSLVKKIMEMNPELTTTEMIAIIKESTEVQGSQAGEFASAEVINEKKVFELVAKSLQA